VGAYCLLPKKPPVPPPPITQALHSQPQPESSSPIICCRVAGETQLAGCGLRARGWRKKHSSVTSSLGPSDCPGVEGRGYQDAGGKVSTARGGLCVFGKELELVQNQAVHVCFFQMLCLIITLAIKRGKALRRQGFQTSRPHQGASQRRK
jgi:hypothetical protein